MQSSLFTENETFKLEPSGELSLMRAWLSPNESLALQSSIRKELCLEQLNIRIAGREIPTPRLQAWVGDSGALMRYSGLNFAPAPWTPSLQSVRSKLELSCSARFNSVLVNCYRNERDSVSWHADDEPELGPSPTIASLSLGETRRFCLKPKRGKAKRIDLQLHDGDLLVMSGDIQREWLHAVPKETTSRAERINLTFRLVHAGQARR